MSTLFPPATAVVAIVVLLAGRFRPVPAARHVVDAAVHGPTEDVAILVLEDIERELRTGSGLAAAIAHALDRQPGALCALRSAIGSGASLSMALEDVAPGDPDEAVVIQTLRVCERTGGRMGVAIGRAVLVLRERTAWRRERRVQAAQARLSATVLTLLPLAFAGWGVATSERIRRAYAEIPLCAIAAVLGLLLNAAGWLWMRRLVRGSGE